MNSARAELGLELFEGDALGFGIDQQDDRELEDHDGGEEDNGAPADLLAIKGETAEMSAFMIHWEPEPSDWPLERTRVGKTSEM